MASGEVTRAVETLRRGGLVALPTETVYGLGADAENELAVRRIFAVKGRPSTHPLIVHLARREAMTQWATNITLAAESLARTFWPGPLTLVLKRTGKASDAITGGQDTVALRVPNHPLALAVLDAFGGGIAAPSANRFGHVSPTTAEHVRADLGSEVDLVLDGGPCEVGLESTIVDVSGETVRVLRPGAISRDDVARIVGRPVVMGAADADLRAPGMLQSHYAPRAGVCVVPAAKLADEAARQVAHGLHRVAVLSPQPLTLPDGATHIAVPADAQSLGRQLYATLRSLDEQGYEVIVVALPDDAGFGQALRDRLTKAAAPRERR